MPVVQSDSVSDWRHELVSIGSTEVWAAFWGWWIPLTESGWIMLNQFLWFLAVIFSCRMCRDVQGKVETAHVGTMRQCVTQHGKKDAKSQSPEFTSAAPKIFFCSSRLPGRTPALVRWRPVAWCWRQRQSLQAAWHLWCQVKVQRAHRAHHPWGPQLPPQWPQHPQLPAALWALSEPQQFPQSGWPWCVREDVQPHHDQQWACAFHWLKSLTHWSLATQMLRWIATLKLRSNTAVWLWLLPWGT